MKIDAKAVTSAIYTIDPYGEYGSDVSDIMVELIERDGTAETQVVWLAMHPFEVALGAARQRW